MYSKIMIENTDKILYIKFILIDIISFDTISALK
jgi:hypothetical protein